MNLSFNKLLDNILTYLFAALFFFVPLILWPKTSEVFEFNKMLFTYILTGTIVSTFATKWILNKQITIKRSVLDLPLLIFLLSQVLSTLFSIDPHTSIWGYYSRFHGGLASTLSYIMLFFLLNTHLSVQNSEARHNRLKLFVLAILASTTIVSIYGVLERLGIDKDFWVQDVQNRVFSTLGQPNWLSAYLAAILPIPIYLSLHSKKGHQTFIYFFLSILFFLTILFTKSRSGIATALIVLLVIFIHQVITAIKNKKSFSKVLVIVSSFFIIVATTGTPWSPNPLTFKQRLELGGPLWSEIEPLLNHFHLTSQVKPLNFAALSPDTQDLLNKRNSGIRVGGSDSFEIRRVVWQGAIDLFKQHPILGTGVETFGYSYYWTRPSAHNLLSEWDFLYNKAHNEYLNFLSTTGAFGFLSYLFFILSTLYLFLSLATKENHDTSLLPAFFLGFITILITNYFGFSVVPIAILFFTYPSLALSTSDTTDEYYFKLGQGWQLTKKDHKRDDDSNISTFSTISLIFVLLIFLYFLNSIYRSFLADINYNKGKAYAYAGYIGESIDYLEKAADLNKKEPVYTAILSEEYAQAALAIHQQLSSTEASGSAQTRNQVVQTQDQYAKKAIDTINLTIQKNPWHLNFLKSKAKVELTLAAIDPAFFEQSLHTLLQATKIAPTDAKILFNIAIIYEEINQDTSAIDTLRKTLELKPDYQQARVELMELYIKNKQFNEARLELPLLLKDFPDHPLKQLLK